MRIFLTLIISITLAFQGVANAMTAEPHCSMGKSPMEHGGSEKGVMAHGAAGHAEMMHAMHMDVEMHMDMSQEHDCCNDLETYLKTGQMCKTSHTCSAPGAGLLAAMLTVSAAPFTTDFFPDISPSLRSAHPIGVWRPPTFS